MKIDHLTAEAVEAQLMQNFQPLINYFKNKPENATEATQVWADLRQRIKNAVRQISVTSSNLDHAPFKDSFIETMGTMLKNVALEAAHALINDVTIDVVDGELVLMSGKMDADLIVKTEGRHGVDVAGLTARHLFRNADFIVVAPDALNLVQQALAHEGVPRTADPQVALLTEFFADARKDVAVIFVGEDDMRSPAELFNECLKLLENSGLGHPLIYTL